MEWMQSGDSVLVQKQNGESAAAEQKSSNKETGVEQRWGRGGSIHQVIRWTHLAPPAVEAVWIWCAIATESEPQQYVVGSRAVAEWTCSAVELV